MGRLRLSMKEGSDECEVHECEWLVLVCGLQSQEQSSRSAAPSMSVASVAERWQEIQESAEEAQLRGFIEAMKQTGVRVCS